MTRYLPLHGSTANDTLRFTDLALLSDAEALAHWADAAARPVAWSGTLADTPFGSDPRNWGESGVAALDASCRALASSSVRPVVRPHASHVVSDGPACARFLERWGDGPGLGLLVDPVSCLTPAMAHAAEDHVARLLERLLALPGVAGLLLSGARLADGVGGRRVVASPPSAEGLLSLGFLGEAVRRAVRAGVPVLAPADQAAALSGAAGAP